ncbi:unnamed protein product [Rhizoctonia solani]|uniref:Brl1/Brr6 domain-containing protein n=1 Tax=Rhizoctonia solani TaxID=456999 RepID=A0A8H3BGL8_9AGAM|nr:unnamed protein product [Rhizoctonia solani]
MPRPFERRSREAPMDYTYDSADRNVYAPGSPFVTSAGSSSRSPSFPTPQHGQPSFAGGFAGAVGNWNSRSNAMPEPEIADVTMESIDLSSSPKKTKSAPSSPQKAQVANYGSESDEGVLAPLPVVKARKQLHQVRRRPRRATSAPIGEGKNAAEINQCTSQYLLNKCDKGKVVPHMQQFCDGWKKCMQRDASVVGRARVAAETLAEVVNGFVEPITWKTLGFSVSTLAFLVLFINVSASLMRPTPPPQPEYQAPPYPYHTPYAVMPPEWGSVGWNEGQGDPGPKMIRASSEVPGQRRSVSVRR